MPSPSGCEYIIAVTDVYVVILIQVILSPSPSLSILSESALPFPSIQGIDTPKPKFIQPVDPMAWSNTREWSQHDVLLSVSEEGELAFWAPDVGNGHAWRCTGQVKTGRKGFKKAKCSSMKKTALGRLYAHLTPRLSHSCILQWWVTRMVTSSRSGTPQNRSSLQALSIATKKLNRSLTLIGAHHRTRNRSWQLVTQDMWIFCANSA